MLNDAYQQFNRVELFGFIFRDDFDYSVCVKKVALCHGTSMTMLGCFKNYDVHEMF